MDWSDTDDTRSLSFGETGIRLVLQRLAPSSANLGRLAALIDANAHDEHCELMSGSAGTILAGREVGADVSTSVEWLRSQRDEDGLWTQRGLGERPVRYLGPAHGFAGCVLALGDVGGRLGHAAPLCRRGGRPRQLAAGSWVGPARQPPRTDSRAVVSRGAGHRCH